MKSFNHIIPSRAKVVAFAFLLSLALVACGGDSGSNAISESSSDSVAEASSGGGKGNSSGSVVPASSSSVKEGGSSSSVETDEKSSSSVDKNGSSSSNRVFSSSSADMSCEADEEGETMKVLKTGIRYICTNGFWVEISSSSATSSSSYYDMAEQFNPDIEYGSMTDPRDGKIYKTVKVKYGYRGVDSVTIFAENLNYGQMVAGGSVQGNSTKYCYNDDPWYCDNGFGGLYSWSNAMNFPAACDSNALGTEACPNKFNLSHENEKMPKTGDYVQHQGICPDGWHVMNEDVWIVLLERSGESLFCSVYGSKAVFYESNKYGVSILPGGQWHPDGFVSMGKFAEFWLPQQNAEKGNVAFRTYFSQSTYNRAFGSTKVQGFSIRCVQNY